MISEQSEQGFTLLEIMACIMILGIIFTFAVPMYINSIRDANDDAVIIEASTVTLKIQSYENNPESPTRFPSTLSSPGFGYVKPPTRDTMYAIAKSADESTICLMAYSPGGSKFTAENPYTIVNNEPVKGGEPCPLPTGSLVWQ